MWDLQTHVCVPFSSFSHGYLSTRSWHGHSAHPPTPSHPRSVCGSMQTNSTNTVLYAAIKNRGPSCVPEEYKIWKARHSSPPYPRSISILHGDRSPESVQILQQWPLKISPSHLPVNEEFHIRQIGHSMWQYVHMVTTYSWPSNIANIPHCCRALNSCYFK